jgi:D-serine deaminase-like pyridoxal phosphate-dependent protein
MSSATRRTLPALVDLDIGMGRTGTDEESAFALYQLVSSLPGLAADGIHAYDGHLKEPDPSVRAQAGAGGVASVLRLRKRLESEGLAVPRLVLGGTPSFPIHSALKEPGVECSAGTAPLNDTGYGSNFPDLPFVPAALLLTRVISGPRGNRITLDLGHKAVAADPKKERFTLLGVPGAVLGPQSEEHQVVETPHAHEFPAGTPLLAIPTHVCPTCALHRWAYVVEGGEVVDQWEVAARDRVIGV